MIRLLHSEERKRKIRQDDVPDLAIPTFKVVSDAIRAGRIDEALEFLEYGQQEDTRVHDSLVQSVDGLCRYISDKFGEEEIPKAFRVKNEQNARREWLLTPTPEGLLHRGAENQRAHHGSFTVTEEPDRYVVKADPCGSGGRLWRTGGQGGVIGVSKKAYPWSFGRVGVPYYCCHCCMLFEIIPIETQGYPARINIPGERPEDPCTIYYYKKPELIPEEYYHRVGKTKKIK